MHIKVYTLGGGGFVSVSIKGNASFCDGNRLCELRQSLWVKLLDFTQRRPDVPALLSAAPQHKRAP